MRRSRFAAWANSPIALMPLRRLAKQHLGVAPSGFDSAAHYRRCYIRKRKHGYRELDVPASTLLTVQRHILSRLDSFVSSEVSYTLGHGIVQAARAHLDSGLLIRLDIHNFFGSLTYEKLRRCAEIRRWSEHLGLRRSELFALSLCDGRLPQGAATSPILSEMFMKEVDTECAVFISNVIEQAGISPDDCALTRYADDIVVSIRRSASRETLSRRFIRRIIDGICRALWIYRLTAKPAKTFVYRAHTGAPVKVLGLSVTGLRPGLGRSRVERLQAMLFKLSLGNVLNPREMGFLAFALTLTSRPCNGSVRSRLELMGEEERSPAGAQCRTVLRRLDKGGLPVGRDEQASLAITMPRLSAYKSEILKYRRDQRDRRDAWRNDQCELDWFGTEILYDAEGNAHEIWSTGDLWNSYEEYESFIESDANT